MIMQVYQTLQNFTNASGQNGLDQIFLYDASVVSIFIPMLLLTLWAVATFGGFFAQRSIENSRGNFWGWNAVGWWFVSVVSWIMSLVPNLINSYIIGVAFVLSIVSTIIFLLQENRIPY